jgi:hypothetical protein
MTAVELGFRQPIGRRGFIGGSDARIIMGNDEAALVGGILHRLSPHPPGLP